MKDLIPLGAKYSETKISFFLKNLTNTIFSIETGKVAVTYAKKLLSKRKDKFVIPSSTVCFSTQSVVDIYTDREHPK